MPDKCLTKCLTRCLTSRRDPPVDPFASPTREPLASGVVVEAGGGLKAVGLGAGLGEGVAGRDPMGDGRAEPGVAEGLVPFGARGVGGDRGGLAFLVTFKLFLKSKSANRLGLGKRAVRISRCWRRSSRSARSTRSRSRRICLEPCWSWRAVSASSTKRPRNAGSRRSRPASGRVVDR